MHMFHAFMDAIIKATLLVAKVLALGVGILFTVIAIIVSSAFK